MNRAKKVEAYLYDQKCGEVAFEAYSKAMGGKTHDGKPIPDWADLTNVVRNAWVASAVAVQCYWLEDEMNQ